MNQARRGIMAERQLRGALRMRDGGAGCSALLLPVLTPDSWPETFGFVGSCQSQLMPDWKLEFGAERLVSRWGKIPALIHFGIR